MDKSFQIITSPGIVIRAELSNSLRNTLKIMLKKNLIHPFDTVHFAFKKSAPFEAEFSSQIDQQFIIPPIYSVSKNYDEIVSGGDASVELLFQLDIGRSTYDIAISGVSSGLEKWENLALILGTFYYAGLAKFEHPHVQDRIAMADRNFTTCPEDLIVSRYIKNVFDAIEGASVIIAA